MAEKRNNGKNLKRLINEHKFLKSQIRIEYGIQMGFGKKRADIVIFDQDATDEQKKDQHNIQIIVECKKEAVKPTDKNNGNEQLKTVHWRTDMPLLAWYWGLRSPLK